MRKRYFYLVLFAMVFLLWACKDQNSEIDYNPNINTAVESVMAQIAFTDVFNLVFMAVKDTSLINSGFAEINGAQVYYHENPDPRIRFQYPGYSFLCPDDCRRSGEFTVDYDGPLSVQGSIGTISFDEYYFGYFKLEGTQEVGYEGLNQDQHETYTNVVSSGQILVADSINPYAYTWNAEQELVWILGSNTPHDYSDDFFTVTGLSSGTSSTGIEYEINISLPLANDFSCKWIPVGLQDISTPTLMVKSGQIDFLESDSCSNYLGFMFDGNPFYTKLEPIQ
jgi:hypothetical protein